MNGFGVCDLFQLFLRYKRFLLHVRSLLISQYIPHPETLDPVLYTPCTTDSRARCKARQAGLFLLVDIYYTHDIGGSRWLMSFRIINDSCGYNCDIACFYNTILF